MTPPPAAAKARVLRLQPGHAAPYRALMLAAYAEHPSAFTSTPEERAGLPLSWWQHRLDGGPEPASLVLGAWAGEELVGAAGLSFAQGRKTRHKADLFGMVVRQAWQGQGLGDALVQAVLDQARARPGVRLIQLTVTEGNGPAQALYARHGFQPFGLEPEAVEVDGRYLTKLHLWRPL